MLGWLGWLVRGGAPEWHVMSETFLIMQMAMNGIITLRPEFGPGYSPKAANE